MINSKDYWDDLLEEKNEHRENQSSFFAKLAIDNLPKWISEDIEDRKMTVCDAGCALGDGTKIWADQFPENKIIGIDFSPNAIHIAADKYKNCEFQVKNIKELTDSYDVIFSSNVLEHFFSSDKLMRHLVLHSLKYCIFLLPFREYYTVQEHCSYFDFQSFPLKMDESYELCYFKPMVMVGNQQEFWFGEQILVVYGEKSHLKSMSLTLKNMYNGYIEDRTSIIRSYDSKIERLKYKSKEELDLLSARLNEEKEELRSKIGAKENALKRCMNLSANKIACFEGKLNEAEARYQEQIKKYESLNIEKEHLEFEKAKLVIELRELKKEKLNDIKVNEQKAEWAENLQLSMGDAVKHICILQSATIYKWSLVLQRFIVQCFRKREKRDFLKWVVGRMIKKNWNVKALAEFDYLEHVKRILRIPSQADRNIHMLPLAGHADIRLKETPPVIIFASVPFYDVGGGQRSAQLAKTFNTLGYRVYYIYGFSCTEENVPDMMIPAVQHEIIDNVTIEWFSSIIDKDSIVIFEIPYAKFSPYLDMAKRTGCHTIYEHIDNWDSSLGCLFYEKKVLEEFLLNSDTITVTARMLGEKIESLVSREYIYLPNAVNIEVFEPLKQYDCPKDLVKGRYKTLLYFGSLWGEWFEWDKIDYLSEQCPDCEINLIGDYSGCIEKVKSAKKNVHFLGLKKQTDLPAYLKYTDIALLPFQNCAIGKYVSPLKIFEYIAMNVRVLATNLDDIKNYPNVYCSDSKEDWAKEVRREVKLKDCSAFISENNWFARCEKLLEGVEAKKIIFPSISIIVLNYNNLNVIGRCVDTLLAQRKRYSYEIIVVDNGSADGSLELLKNRYSGKIVLLENSKNGCSSGRNLGAKYANGKYLCFLDSDQWVVSNYWLDNALLILESNSQIGATAWNAGWFEAGKTTGPIVDYLPNRGLESTAIWYRMDIAYLATSGFLMEKALFDSIGGFDEFYDPTCFEDTDISLKIRNAGLELAYCPYMGIMHLPHQTTKSGSTGHTKLMERNGKYFENKWKQIKPELLEYYL